MEFPGKNLLVLASAGSGKTFRLSDRIIGLMAREVEPERIAGSPAVARNARLHEF